MFAAMCCAHPAQMCVSWRHLCQCVMEYTTAVVSATKMLLGKCVGGNEQSEKVGKIQKSYFTTFGPQKVNLPTQNRVCFFRFSDSVVNSACLVQTRGSKELHNEILHYTYDIHDHCLPRFLVKRHLNEWNKK